VTRDFLIWGVCFAIFGAGLYMMLIEPIQQRVAWRSGYAAGVNDYPTECRHVVGFCVWTLPEPPKEYGGR
jgi:hypothetical protein